MSTLLQDGWLLMAERHREDVGQRVAIAVIDVIAHDHREHLVDLAALQHLRAGAGDWA